MGVFEMMPYTNLHQQNLDWLMKTVASYQESIDTLNSWRVEFTGRVEDVESAVSNLQTAYNALYDAFGAFKNEVGKEFDERSNLLNIQFQTLRNDLQTDQATFKAQINAQFAELLNELETYKNYQQEYLEARLQQFLDNLPDYTQILVINPVRGYMTTVQQAIDDLYDTAVRYDALTAQEYDSAGLTAQRYDDMDLTSQEYDLYGRNYIAVTDKLTWMYNPFTGVYSPVREVVKQLAELHRTGAITAQAYDLLALSAEEYDDKEITAYNYDFDAVNLLSA